MKVIRELLEKHAIRFDKTNLEKFTVGNLYVCIRDLDFDGTLDKLRLREDVQR